MTAPAPAPAGVWRCPSTLLSRESGSIPFPTQPAARIPDLVPIPVPAGRRNVPRAPVAAVAPKKNNGAFGALAALRGAGAEDHARDYDCPLRLSALAVFPGITPPPLPWLGDRGPWTGH